MKRSLGAHTILYPTPVLIVGTYDAAGKPNVMAISWGGICCSAPPCVTISVRKNRHSFQALIDRQAFTINLPSEAHIREADYFGTASGKNTDKFADTGLTPVRSDIVDAPYIEEFPLVLECCVIHVHELGIHTQFIGEILDVKADDNLLDEQGHPDITRLQPFCYDPQQSTYYAIGRRLGKVYSLGNSFTRKTDR